MKIAGVFLCLLLLLTGFGLADTGNAGDIGIVSNVNEYVTLRETPRRKGWEITRIPLGGKVIYLSEPEGDFSEVCYKGKIGYVLSEYLTRREPETGTAVTPDEGLVIRLNLFLTAFTDTWFGGNGAFTMEEYGERDLVDFAVDTLFNRNREYGEWGDYNVRIDGQEIPQIVDRYFGVSVNVTDTRYWYQGGYYYSQETGGRSTGGFAILDGVEVLESGLYRVAFTVYGEGESWKPEAVCTLSASRAQSMYKVEHNRQGTAVINMNGSPENEENWKLISYILYP
ncbi:MAG: SH3 domain-containing protein [Clostridia bacterium]|nr:SH3 domain-containing protein [Clostridia bacterium]